MEDTDPLHSLIHQAACAHAWLLDRLRRKQDISHDQEALDRLMLAKEHVEGVAASAARDAGESDPFLPISAVPNPDTVGWFDAGFSALLLHLVMLHVRPPGAAKDSQENTLYGAMTENTDAFARYALRRRVSRVPPKVETDIRTFEIPAVQAWGVDFLRRAVKILDGRLPRRQVLKEAMAVLKDAGLPDDPWIYVEPQLDFHGKAFGIGFVKKNAIKAGLWLTK